jgi:uncharacterized protein YegJ (DUF2314 family)
MKGNVMKRTALALLVVTMLIVGCSDRSENPVIEVEADDIEMNAAIAHARVTVDEFVKRLQKPKPMDESFSVKKMIEDNGDVEHFWLIDISYSDGIFTGTVGNVPQSVRNVKFGQKVNVAESEITDWMYLDDGKLVGNFTLQVLLKRMPKEQAEALRKQLQMNN